MTTTGSGIRDEGSESCLIIVAPKGDAISDGEIATALRAAQRRDAERRSELFCRDRQPLPIFLPSCSSCCRRGVRSTGFGERRPFHRSKYCHRAPPVRNDVLHLSLAHAPHDLGRTDPQFPYTGLGITHPKLGMPFAGASGCRRHPDPYSSLRSSVSDGHHGIPPIRIRPGCTTINRPSNLSPRRPINSTTVLAMLARAVAGKRSSMTPAVCLSSAYTNRPKSLSSVMSIRPSRTARSMTAASSAPGATSIMATASNPALRRAAHHCEITALIGQKAHRLALGTPSSLSNRQSFLMSHSVGSKGNGCANISR